MKTTDKFLLVLGVLLSAHFGIAQNLLQSGWTVGSGSVTGFNQNGNSQENNRIWGTTPFGDRGIIWEATPDAESNSDGGWNSDEFDIDHTKLYRFIVWIKKTNSHNGVSYLGCNTYPSTVNTLNGSTKSNPYFWYGDLPELNKWYLVVGFIHGSGDNSTTNIGAIYDGVTGVMIKSITDYKFPTSATKAKHRSYLYYDTNTSDRQYFYAPRVDEINGEEPSIDELLKLNRRVVSSSSKKTLNQGWYTIAKNGGSRASAKFSIREARSSYHSATHFYAQHHYGTDNSNQLNVLANSSYKDGGAFRKIRIVEGSTYAGALVQVYIDVNSTTGCYVEITENTQTSGWTIVDWQPATMTLPKGETGKVAVEVDLDINNGMIISDDLWIGNKLEVNGTIRSKEVKVEASPWPDYVFSSDYKLRSLAEIEAYIQANQHLPEVPPAEEVAENGIALGEMNALLLKKIEELTLYQIEMMKIINLQQEAIDKLNDQ